MAIGSLMWKNAIHTLNPMVSKAMTGNSNDEIDDSIKDDAVWQEDLTEDQYRVAREGGTEPAFTGKYWDTKTEGVYACVCCGDALFGSDTKFDSGTGWPSFFKPVSDGAIREKEDRSMFMARTEVVCSRCDAHLGHVFPDGPAPTGLRYCLNSASLDLKVKES